VARQALGNFLDFDDAEDVQLFVDHVLGQFRLLRTWSEGTDSLDPSDPLSAPPGA
jgi:hypothetical protein